MKTSKKTKSLLVIVILAFQVTQLYSQKLKLESNWVYTENYPEVILTGKFETYTIRFTNKGNDPVSQGMDPATINKYLHFKTLKYSATNADLTIEFILEKEIFVSKTENHVTYKYNNTIKLYDANDKSLYNGSITQFYPKTQNEYARSIQLGDGGKGDFIKNLRKEAEYAGDGLRKIFEFNVTRNTVVFMRIKGDEKYEKLVDRIGKYFLNDTIFINENNSDSLTKFITELAQMKAESTNDAEVNARYNYSIKSNQAILYSFMKEHHKADSLLQTLPEIDEKEVAQKHQADFITNRKKNADNYKYVLDLSTKPEYDPYSIKK